MECNIEEIKAQGCKCEVDAAHSNYPSIWEFE